MGQNKTPEFFRGFLVPYGITESNIWSSQSTFNQSGSRSGVPESQQTGTGLILETTGDQNQDIEIETVKGGSAGTGAGFVWKDSGSNSYGRDAVNSILGFQYWRFIPHAVAGSIKSVDAVATQSGVLITTYNTFIPTGTLHQVIVKRQDKSSPAGFETSLFSEQLTGTEALPAVCELSDGSLIVCHFRPTSNTQLTIGVHRSTDDGQTWTEISTGALSRKIDTTDFTPKKLRLSANDFSIVMIMELVASSGSFRNRIAQYVSYDRGASFEFVGISDPSGTVSFHQSDIVTLPDGSFGVVTIGDLNQILFRRLPYSSFDLTATSYSLNQIEITNTGSFPVSLNSGGTELTDGNLCMWLDDDKILYVVAQNVTDKSLTMFASYDSGDTWLFMGGGSTLGTLSTARFYQPNTTGSALTKLSGCRWEGRSVLLGINDISVGMLFLGGYANKNLPSTERDPTFTDFIRWDSSWVPFELPAVSSIYTMIGTGTEALSSAGVTLTTSSTIKHYTHIPTITNIVNGLIVRYRVKVLSGGRTNANDICVRLRLDDGGSNSFHAVIRYTTSSFVVVDEISSTTKLTETVTMTNDVEFIVAMINGKMTVLFREWSFNDARLFVQRDITGLTNGGGGSTDLISWGHITSPPSNTESLWSEFHFSVDGSTGLQMIGTLTPSYRLYPLQGEFLYINGGMSLTTRDSPAYENDKYKINRRYDYSINRLFFKNSTTKRVTWRSESVASGPITTQRIAFQLDPKLGNVESQLGSDLLGIHLSGINFRTFKVKRYDVGTSAWVTMATVDTSSGLTSTFNRVGNTINFSGAGGDSFYLHHSECLNWRVQLGSGDSSSIRPIESNSEGVWNGNTAKKAIVKMSDIDNTEPTSGNVFFMPDDVTVLISLNGETGSAWAIEIDTQETFEKYFQIGSLTFGSVAVVAPVYGRGRSLTYETNSQLFRTLDGSTYVRKLSDGRRVASVSWTDGVDTSSLFDGNPDPQYWQFSTTAGAVPVANYGDAPYMLTGLYRFLGQHTPIVYLPSWKKSTGVSSDVVILNRYHQHIRGLTEGNVSIDHVVGDELQGNNQGEIFRVSTIQIRELE